MSIENPTTRDEHIQHARMLVGEPVLKINITDMQAILCVKQSMFKFLEYHDNSVSEAWMTQEITTQLAASHEFQVPDAVRSVVEVEGVSNQNWAWTSMVNPFAPMSINNPIGNWYGGVVGYDKVTMHLVNQSRSYVDAKLSPPPAWTFNATTKRLKIFDQTDSFVVGNVIGYKAHVSVEKVDSDFWADNWFLRYSAALIKKQWASNLIKFANVDLAGGHQLNVDAIAAEAKDEIERLETELHDSAALFFEQDAIG